MADDKDQPDQFEKDADATTGGGASTERGSRDAGMPGPAPGAATGGAKRYADSTESDAAGTGATGTAPTHSADEQPGAAGAGTGSGPAPKPTT